jgi:TonB-linked outer membrane protein, SusC/RagA family
MQKKLLLLTLLALCCVGWLHAQHRVSGVVTEAKGEPIPSVYVSVKGVTNVIVSTDFNGRYAIDMPAGTTTLVFSMIGMRTEEVIVNGRSVINVVMEDDAFAMEEVMVIGYGSEKKKNVSGSVANIRSDEISKASVENFQKAIQGKAAGVQITSASGTPGGSVNILIRGRGSISGGTSPLYVIDGVQVITGQQGDGTLTSTDPLSGLRPDDIESIDILKDGASASIYGAQAANGVIFITTKKGIGGKTKFSFKSSMGWQNVSHQVPTLSGPEFAELTLLSFKNFYGEGSQNYLDKLANYRSRGWGDDGFSLAPTYDWFNAVFGTGYSQDYQLSMSGGNDKTTFFASGGYTVDNGSMKYTWFKRASARLNLSHKVNDWFTFSTNNSFSNVHQRQTTAIAAANPSRSAMVIQPTNPIYNPDGSYVENLEDGYYEHNILQVLDLNKYLGTTNKWTSGNDLTFNIMRELTFKSSYGVDYMEMNEHLFMDPRTRQGKSLGGRVGNSDTRSVVLQTDQVLTYQNTFKDIHRVTAMLGFSFIKSDKRYSVAEGTGVSSPDMQLLSATAIPTLIGEAYTGYKTIGMFTRLGYILNDKYIFNATIRRDGSSRFGKSRRFGTFPSISAAWRVSGEPFMEGFTFIDDMKLKASYGVTGNSEMGGNFIAHRLYAAGVSYDGKSGVSPNSVGNDMLTWEESHSANFGIAAAFLNNRFSFDIDYYITNTKSLLYERDIPFTTGFGTMISNIGGVRNSGLEILINSENIRAGGFVWSTNLNVAFSRNEITALIDDQTIVGSLKVGESISSGPVYHWAGVNPSDGRPMYYSQEGYITYTPRPEDRIWTPGVDPKFFGGLTNTLSYAGIDLSFTFQFQSGARSRWSDKIALIYYDGDGNVYRDLYTQHWSQPGDYTWVSKPVLGSLYPGDAYPMTSESDLIYEKTDFIKLKTLSLSYNLPKKWLSSTGLTAAQLYFQGYNIWTTTTYLGYDPEFVGSDRATYPQARVFSLGLKIDF